jgi:hypothetical protein
MKAPKAVSLLAAFAASLLLLCGLSPSAEAQRTGTRRASQQQQRRVLIVGGRDAMSGNYPVNGRRVRVIGNSNRIVLYGPCPSLYVSGLNNHVYTDSVRVVSLEGRNNRVYWRRLYNGRSRPRVSGATAGNRVLRRTRV